VARAIKFIKQEQEQEEVAAFTFTVQSPIDMRSGKCFCEIYFMSIIKFCCMLNLNVFIVSPPKCVAAAAVMNSPMSTELHEN